MQKCSICWCFSIWFPGQQVRGFIRSQLGLAWTWWEVLSWQSFCSKQPTSECWRQLTPFWQSPILPFGHHHQHRLSKPPQPTAEWQPNHLSFCQRLLISERLLASGTFVWISICGGEYFKHMASLLESGIFLRGRHRANTLTRAPQYSKPWYPKKNISQNMFQTFVRIKIRGAHPSQMEFPQEMLQCNTLEYIPKHSVGPC